MFIFFRLIFSRHVLLFLISIFFLYSQFISFWFTFHFILIHISFYFDSHFISFWFIFHFIFIIIFLSWHVKSQYLSKYLQKKRRSKNVNENNEKCELISNDEKKNSDSKKWTNIEISLIILNVIKQNTWEDSKISNVHKIFDF